MLLAQPFILFYFVLLYTSSMAFCVTNSKRAYARSQSTHKIVGPTGLENGSGVAFGKRERKGKGNGNGNRHGIVERVTCNGPWLVSFVWKLNSKQVSPANA